MERGLALSELRDAVIYDCDGTLVNVESIVHLVEGKTRNFHQFHRQSVNCPPNDHVVEALVNDFKSGLDILIVTARIERYWPETKFWLSLNVPVPYQGLYMRKMGDYRKDGLVKQDILDLIRSEGYNVVHAWDDNPAVIEVWERNGIPTTKVKGHWYK